MISSCSSCSNRSPALALLTIWLIAAMMCACSSSSNGDPPGDADSGDTETSDAETSDTETPDADDTEISDASDTSDQEGDIPPSAAPPIDEALQCPVADLPARSVTPGTDLMRVTLDADNAICNDGSPGVFYIRPGSAQNADRWVIWLEGGGGCTSATSCASRWCGNSVPNTPAKMSSRWAPMGIEGTGIFDQSPPGEASNDFADWNHVVLYYCSSDAWSGQLHQLRAVDASGELPDFSLHFEGQAILDAAMEQLRNGATSDDEAVTMPSLDDASMVLFSGTSAGGAGARLNADRVESQLRSSNPQVDFRLVVDAGVVPRVAGPDLSQEELDAFYEQSADVAINFRGSDTDASCLEFHGDDPSRCYDSTHVLIHHVEAPSFIKMDVTDPVDSPSVYPDLPAFERAVRDYMSQVINGEFMPEESSVPLPEVVFAPKCGHHVAMESREFYSVQLDANGSSVSFHDALAAWVEGDNPPSLLDGDGAPPTSVCSLQSTPAWPTSPGRHDVTFDVNGVERSLHLVLPAGFSAQQPAPMLVMFHGAGGNARGFADGFPELRQLAEDRGWILAFPQGLDNSSGASSWAWSSEPITEEWSGPVPDDVSATLSAMQVARDQLGADPAQIYLAGFSKGGRMAQHLAALHPERFQAVAMGSTSTGSTFLDAPEMYRTAIPAAPVPTLLSHGTADPLLPYNGDEDVTPFSESVEHWRVANECAQNPTETGMPPVSAEVFSGCAAPLRAVTIDGLAHQWPEAGDNAGFSMSAATFTFFDSL